MRTIVKIKNKIKTNRVIRPIYLRYWYLKQRIIEAEAFKKLRTDGHSVIDFVQNSLEGKVFFFFEAGTLLGIVREGRLLRHDNDIDVAVRAYEKEEIDKTRKILLKAGCRLARTFTIEGKGTVEDAFEIYGLRFDVFYINHGDPMDYCYLMYKGPETQETESEWNVMRLKFTPVTRLKKIEYEGLMVNVPEDAEEHLREKYGDWEKPNKYFDYQNAPNTEKTDLIGISLEF